MFNFFNRTLSQDEYESSENEISKIINDKPIDTVYVKKCKHFLRSEFSQDLARFRTSRSRSEAKKLLRGVKEGLNNIYAQQEERILVVRDLIGTTSQIISQYRLLKESIESNRDLNRSMLESGKGLTKDDEIMGDIIAAVLDDVMPNRPTEKQLQSEIDDCIEKIELNTKKLKEYQKELSELGS